MNSARLFSYYESFADTPDAIMRLRRFILKLAVRGKLVSQEPKDQPATELLSRLTQEKMRLAKARQITDTKNPESFDKLTLPCDLPRSNWAWIGLNQLGRIAGGMTPSMSRSDYWDGTVSWLSPKDIKADEVSASELKITELGLKETRLEAYPIGSLFIVARSGILKRTLPVAINRQPAAANQDMKVLVPFVAGLDRYLQIMLRGFEDFILTELVKTGTTVQSLKYDEFEVQPFPVPPLAEQHRIVAKVDELMALCDRLEAARAEREATRDRLTASTLARLNTPDPITFQADVHFALNTLQPLTTRLDQIKQLRQTILNLAVRGKLVPQMAQEKTAPIGRADEGVGFDDRLDFLMPSEWRWVRLEQVASARLGKMLDKTKNKGLAYSYLRNTNVHWFDIRVDDLKTILLEDREFKEYCLQKDDVLICEGGHGIGRTAVWNGAQENVVFQKALHRVRSGPHLNPQYFTMCCAAYFECGVMQRYFTGVGIPHFTGRALAKLVFPLPPLAEQHRIVAKVNALMTICDQLESSLNDTATTRRHLLDALLAEALAPAETQALEAAE